jgi:hypothetical protein
MSAEHGHEVELVMNDRAFTVMVCTGCTAGQGLSVVDEIRDTIRRCPHAVLVATGCILGPLACASRPDRPGVLVVLQPCSIDRVPIGPASWVGPINDRHDAAELCDWVERGEWGLGSLPQHLRPALNRMRHVGNRN